MCEKTPQMLAVQVDFQVVAYRVRHKGLMRALWWSPFSPLRYVEYAAFRDVMDVFVFCFWQRVLGSIQPPTYNDEYVCYFHLIFSCPASNSDELCYHFVVHLLPQEGVSAKKKDVTLRGTFFPKTNCKSPLGKGRLEGHKSLLLEFVPLQRPC